MPASILERRLLFADRMQADFGAFGIAKIRDVSNSADLGRQILEERGWV